MSEKRKLSDELIFNNPVFGMYLGICSVLAITNNINNALGMGVSVIVVLVLSNSVFSCTNYTRRNSYSGVYHYHCNTCNSGWNGDACVCA